MTTERLDLPAAVIGYDETVDAGRYRVLGIGGCRMPLTISDLCRRSR
jgi:hypothetical protein